MNPFHRHPPLTHEQWLVLLVLGSLALLALFLLFSDRVRHPSPDPPRMAVPRSSSPSP